MDEVDLRERRPDRLGGGVVDGLGQDGGDDLLGQGQDVGVQFLGIERDIAGAGDGLLPAAGDVPATSVKDWEEIDLVHPVHLLLPGAVIGSLQPVSPS